MNIYSIVLFLHISSAIGVCIGISVLLLGVALLRRAQEVEQVRTTLAFVTTAFPIAGFSMLLLLAAGFYLALTAWSLRTSWIAVTLISLVLMIALGAGLIGPRMRAIVTSTRESPDGSLSSQLSTRVQDPILFTVLLIQAVLLLGIVFLMTTKPGLANSSIVMVVALVLGLALGLLVSRTRRSRDQEMAARMDRTREPVA
jgi:Predicted integral membrane protein (DUF2269)